MTGWLRFWSIFSIFGPGIITWFTLLFIYLREERTGIKKAMKICLWEIVILVLLFIIDFITYRFSNDFGKFKDIIFAQIKSVLALPIGVLLIFSFIGPYWCYAHCRVEELWQLGYKGVIRGILLIIGLIILMLLTWVLIFGSIKPIIDAELPWWRITIAVILFIFILLLGIACTQEVSHDGSELGGLLLFAVLFSIAGGFPYAQIYNKSKDKVVEWKAKRVVKLFLKEKSNDGTVDIVNWNEYRIVNENEKKQFSCDYYISVTVRLKNKYGAKEIHTFHLFLQKKPKMKVVECDPSVSSVLTYDTSPNAPPYIGVTSEAA